MVIAARALSRRYGARWALARLDLEVGPGERLLVVGANGSGKTTLLRLLSTMLLPSLGELRLFDRPSTDPSVRAKVALLTHHLGLYEDLSGPENLRVLLGLLGRADERPEPLLERVGLEVRPDPVRGYSAGMRKRLAFARAIAQRPELLLLDEPYGALDPAGFNFVDTLVRELNEQGTTMVIASHQVARAGALCPRAMLLDRGQVRWEGAGADAERAWVTLHGGAA